MATHIDFEALIILILPNKVWYNKKHLFIGPRPDVLTSFITHPPRPTHPQILPPNMTPNVPHKN